jgi:hypothetical protein
VLSDCRTIRRSAGGCRLGRFYRVKHHQCEPTGQPKHDPIYHPDSDEYATSNRHQPGNCDSRQLGRNWNSFSPDNRITDSRLLLVFDAQPDAQQYTAARYARCMGSHWHRYRVGNWHTDTYTASDASAAACLVRLREPSDCHAYTTGDSATTGQPSR